tara:strand:- start:1854 stop:1976 length:123 start_codon:yes stop_codon:yes gene_type:complete
MRVTALDGRIDIQFPREFLALSKQRLQGGIEAFLETLEEK